MTFYNFAMHYIPIVSAFITIIAFYYAYSGMKSGKNTTEFLLVGCFSPVCAYLSLGLIPLILIVAILMSAPYFMLRKLANITRKEQTNNEAN